MPYDLVDEENLKVTWHYDENIVELESASKSNHRLIHAIGSGETEIYATVEGENGTLSSEKIKISVKERETIDKTDAVYDFSFLGIDKENSKVLTQNNTTSKALFEVTSGPATSFIDGKNSDVFEQGKSYLVVDPGSNEVLNKTKSAGLYFNFGVFAYPITILFIVSVINCINLIDGLDGLSSGIASIYFLTVGIIGLLLNHFGGLDIILTFIMLGSTLGFLLHNFNPAKIFMGDSGSMFLGYIIAVIALLGFKNITLTSFLIPILLLAIPIIDTLFAILRRLINHKPIGEPDKNHLHHQLLKLKLSQRKTVLIIYLVDILFAIASIIYAVGNEILGSNMYGIIIYIILFALTILLVAKTNIIWNHDKHKK